MRPARAAPVCSVSACEPSAVLELNAKLKDAETKRISAEEKLKLPTTFMMASSANFGENPDAAALGKASESRLLERGGGSVTVGIPSVPKSVPSKSVTRSTVGRKDFHNN